MDNFNNYKTRLRVSITLALRDGRDVPTAMTKMLY